MGMIKVLLKGSSIMYTRQNLTVGLILAISMVGISYGTDGILPGDGLSESTAYLIEDLTDFDVFADQANAATYWSSGVYTKLACDPNLAGRPYTTAVIAPDTPDTNYNFNGISFKGVFDGDGHTISNLAIDTAGADNDYLGLFDRIESSGAQVKNLGIENINITGGAYSDHLGGLCGWNYEGTITNCYVTGSVDGSYYLGGLCGKNGDWGNPGGTITNCYADGSVTGGVNSDYLGGLCGENYGTITNCYATGSVTGGDNSWYLGGLCGGNYEGTITNCYATGSVAGGDNSDRLGGLCGYNSYGTITNCYATGAVTGGDSSYYLGGLCGGNHEGTITNCYATGSVAGGDNSDRLGGLCGENYGTITNCYATGSVTGGHHLGGLCGRSDEGAITNCYFYLFSGPDNGWGTALDDLEMQDAVSFAGFDFAGNSNDGEDDYWTIVTGYCPKLTWQTDNGPLVPSPPVTTLSGSGYSYDPFQVNSYADFTEFRTNSSLRCGYYILTVDIDLSGDNFTTAVIDGVFGGHFDGNGHIIRNITIDTAGANNDYLGLFGIISASVSNLGIENINITGGADSHRLGGLCGYNYRGTITNCYSTGSVTGGADSHLLGGLCGHNDEGTITNCYATGAVTGGYDAGSLGGLCGINYGTITNCYATGLVNGGNSSNSLGGLCGSNVGTITNCYATGSVTGDDLLGGLCGCNSDTITNCYATGSVAGGDGSCRLGGLCGAVRGGTITNCYATGLVTGGDNSYCLGGLCGYNASGTITNCYALGLVTGGNDSYALGGLCGENSEGTITNCFWDVETSGIGSEGDDNYGATGKTTEQMQTQSTFTDANWDFTNETANGTNQIWQIPTEGGYPVLSNFNGYTPVLLSGNGTEASPYLINNAAELGAIYHYNSNACFRLQSDVDLTGIQWSTVILPTFGGCFDGNGYVIYNMYIEGSGYLGLFGTISGSSAEVKNLGVENINITGGDDSDYLGGLCGCNYYGTITNCYTTGSLAGGYNSRYLGGLCGWNVGTITNCYATGSVTGGDNSWYLGGLCGRNSDTITNCYATGSVTGGDSSYLLGGLCGGSADTITHCFWDVETSGIGIEGDDNCGATGKTTEQMQTESTFTDANWDFSVVPVWHMPFEAIGYPMLGWQKDIPGDFTGRYGVDLVDFAVLAETWPLSSGQTGYNDLCDLIDNDMIDLNDLAVFAQNWLTGKM